MKQTQSYVSFLLALLTMVTIGCGSGSNQDDSILNSSGSSGQTSALQPLNDTSSALEKMLNQMSGNQQSSLTLAPNGWQALTQSYTGTVECETVGTMGYDGTANLNETERTASFDMNLNLKGCDQLSGDIRALGDYRETDNQLVYGFDFNGTLTHPDCSFRFDRFTHGLTINSSTETIQATVNGNFIADCSSKGTITCNFQNFDLLAGSFTEPCSCSGELCNELNSDEEEENSDEE